MRRFIEWRTGIVRFWLKTVGAASSRLPNDWLTNAYGSRTDLLELVRFPRTKRPTGISANDRLVYYAAGELRYFAVVEVTSREPIEGLEEERWPYALHVHPLLLVPRLDAAPPLSDLQLHKGNLSVRHQSHIELSYDQFQSAVAGLARVAGLDSPVGAWEDLNEG